MYIVSIAFMIVHKSLSRENKLKPEDKNDLDIRTVSMLLAIAIGIVLFNLFYCVFFFMKLKKRLYTHLYNNSFN